MARSSHASSFPVVPVLVGAGVGFVALALLRKSAASTAADHAAANNAIPVLANAPGGSPSAIQTGNRFSADLSGTQIGNPNIRVSGLTFQAMGPVVQGPNAYVPAMVETTGELVNVPLSRILQVLS